MSCKFLEKFFFPFQTKRFFCFTWIIFVLLGGAAAVSAADEIKDFDVKEAKKLIKQAEKLTRRGHLQEAEKVVRQAIEISTEKTAARLVLSYVLFKQRRLEESYRISLKLQNEPENARLTDWSGWRSSVLAICGSIFIFRHSNQKDNDEPLAWAWIRLIDFYETGSTTDS